MKKQSLQKKNDVKENKTVSAVNLKANDHDFGQLKTITGTKDASQKCEDKQESRKTRNQKKNKRIFKNSVVAENKTIPSKKNNAKNSSSNSLESSYAKNVLKCSIPLPSTTPPVAGYDFNSGVDYSAIFASYKYSGFQATNFSLAVEEILRMLVARRIPLQEDQEDTLESDEFIKRRHSCTIFLGYAADDMVSKGVRDTIRFLAEHRMIDCFVTTARTIEEDLIECLAPRNTYSHFKDWIIPILDNMLAEQKKGVLWTPSKIIARLGEEINNINSIIYWAAKNKIPVFSPALTADGNFGNVIFFHSCKNPGLVIDILSDLKRINTLAIKAITSGVIVVGGGTVKHHVLRSNFMRCGADFGVFLNTIPEYDGSASGARPDEAVSWGEVKKDSKAVKIFAEASLVFPLLIAETFIRHFVSYKMRIVTSV